MTGQATVERWNATPVPERVAERAYTNVEVRADGCWISRYSTGSHGYAQIGWQSKEDGRRVVLAHRAAWVHVNGQVPLGLTFDHICKNRPCVNPDHLRLMSNFENARRTDGRDWEFGKCANGHSNMFLREDPYRRAKGGWHRIGLRCSECKKLYGRRGNWRRDHGDAPYPDHLLLASEKRTVVRSPLKTKHSL